MAQQLNHGCTRVYTDNPRAGALRSEVQLTKVYGKPYAYEI